MIGLRILAFAVTGTLLSGQSVATGKVAGSVGKWPQGKRIEVILNAGERLIGRLGPVHPDGFDLVSEKGARATRTLRLDEVRSVSTKMTIKRKLAIAGIVYASLVVIGAIVLGN